MMVNEKGVIYSRKKLKTRVLLLLVLLLELHTTDISCNYCTIVVQIDRQYRSTDRHSIDNTEHDGRQTVTCKMLSDFYWTTTDLHARGSCQWSFYRSILWLFNSAGHQNWSAVGETCPFRVYIGHLVCSSLKTWEVKKIFFIFFKKF